MPLRPVGRRPDIEKQRRRRVALRGGVGRLFGWVNREVSQMNTLFGVNRFDLVQGFTVVERALDPVTLPSNHPLGGRRAVGAL